MRWWVFAVMGYVLLAMQVGLAKGMAVPAGLGAVEPRFVLLLAVFVGLAAPPSAVVAAWLVLGVLLDLTNTWPLPDGTGLILIGPYALGYLAGAYVILQVRMMLFRNHPLTVGAMVLASGIAVHLVVVAVFTIRAWYQPLAGWSAVDELILRGLGLIYTAVLGVVLAVPMGLLAPWFGFQTSKTASPRGRRR